MTWRVCLLNFILLLFTLLLELLLNPFLLTANSLGIFFSYHYQQPPAWPVSTLSLRVPDCKLGRRCSMTNHALTTVEGSRKRTTARWVLFLLIRFFRYYFDFNEDRTCEMTCFAPQVIFLCFYLPFLKLLMVILILHYSSETVQRDDARLAARGEGWWTTGHHIYVLAFFSFYPGIFYFLFLALLLIIQFN